MRVRRVSCEGPRTLASQPSLGVASGTGSYTMNFQGRKACAAVPEVMRTVYYRSTAESTRILLIRCVCVPRLPECATRRWSLEVYDVWCMKDGPGTSTP